MTHDVSVISNLFDLFEEARLCKGIIDCTGSEPVVRKDNRCDLALLFRRILRRSSTTGNSEEIGKLAEHGIRIIAESGFNPSILREECASAATGGGEGEG